MLAVNGDDENKVFAQICPVEMTVHLPEVGDQNQQKWGNDSKC